MKKRLFISLIIVFLIIGISLPLSAQTFNARKLQPHPRILWTKDGEKAVWRSINRYPQLHSVHKRILNECDKILFQSPVQRELEGKRMLQVSRTALQRILYLSYAYRMTGTERYARRAEQEMLAVCQFTDWNPSHFLDVGEMVMALSIGYDWLYDNLSNEVRHAIRKSIVEKGFDAASPDAYFYRTASNWNSVCNGGLTYGAISLYDEIPDKAETVIKKCLQTNLKVMEVYAPDGGYPEGFHYWGYGTTFQALLIAALESAFGDDFGLSDMAGFLDSAYFMEYMTAPSGEYFNFSDAPEGKAKCNIAMFWFARKLQDLSVLWLESQYLQSSQPQFAEERLLPCLLIFCQDLELDKIKEPDGHLWCNRGTTPTFVYRSGWKDSTDSYLAVKGGSPLTPHAHMDVGSFIYEANGIRWAMDLGMQNYYSLESKGIDLWNQSQEGGRWKVFRLQNTAHNTLTINNMPHLVKGKADFEEVFKTDDKKGVKVNLTGTFAHTMDQVKRSAYLDASNILVIEDSLSSGDSLVTVTWNMITPANARIVGTNQIELSKENRRTMLTVQSELPIQMKIQENTPPYGYDAPNPGTLRVGFEVQVPAGRKTLLRTTLCPLE